MAVVDLILTVSRGFRVRQIGVLVLLGLYSAELFGVNDWFQRVWSCLSFTLHLRDLLARQIALWIDA